MFYAYQLHRFWGGGGGRSAVRPQALVKCVGGSTEGKLIVNSVWTRRGGLITSIARGRSENTANCKSSCPNVGVTSKLFSIQQ